MPTLIDKAGNRYEYRTLTEHESSVTLDGDRILDGRLFDFTIDDGSPIRVSPVQFKLLFSPQERVAIKAARASDPVIDDFFEIVEDPRLTFVDLSLQSTQDALAYLEAKELVAAERRTQILAGQVQ